MALQMQEFIHPRRVSAGMYLRNLCVLKSDDLEQIPTFELLGCVALSKSPRLFGLQPPHV